MIEQQQGGAPGGVPPTAPAPAAAPQGPGPAGGGGPDYSAQWAEYYRSIGKTKEAEAIEAQIRAKGPGAGPGGPGGPQPPQPQAAYPGAGGGQPQYGGQPGPGFQPQQGYYPPQPQQGGYPGYE